MEKIKLDIVALSQSITQSHSYAIVLQEAKGERRLPIVIGGFEAQSIAVAIENMTPSRPLTHDLMKEFCEVLKVEVKEVIIDNLVDGVFYAKLICEKDGKKFEIDSRTSDALALAVRFKCPIYTYEFIMDSAGIILESNEDEKIKKEEHDIVKEAFGNLEEKAPKPKEKLSDYNLKELNELLEAALKKEDYEGAAKYRDELERRSKGS